MFTKNDKALLTTRIIIMVTIGILAIASLVAGIWLSVEAEEGLFILITIAGWFVCWLAWVFARLYLSYLCDIKLIRNKLYGENNDDLEAFLKAKNERHDNPIIRAKKKEENAELEHLQELLDLGIITNEEYEKRKGKITK